jgi:hypothetical protein
VEGWTRSASDFKGHCRDGFLGGPNVTIDWAGEPASWALVLLPAMATALVVRWDAKLIGPYFALSALISAMPGLDARYWYDEGPFRRAIQRRCLYPVILGSLLAWLTDLAMTDVAVTGLLAGVLLLWPIIFQGLPWNVPTKSWHLPVLYASFLVAFASLAVGGALLYVLLVRVSDGDVADWLTSEALSLAIVWAVALLSGSVFRAAFRRTREEAFRREELGGEWVSGHDLGVDE